MFMNRQTIYIQGVTYITTPFPVINFETTQSALSHVVVGVILNTFGHTSEFCLPPPTPE